MRPKPLLLLASLACVAASTAGGCGGGSSGGGSVAAPLLPSVSGVVLDYTDDLSRDAPVEVLGGPSGRTRVDGLFVLGPIAPGQRVLRIGDSRTTPTVLVPYTQTSDAAVSLDRPVYLPSLESGIGANLPASISTITTVQGTALPGVSLSLLAGSSVTLPVGSPGEVRVLGISPSRLPAGSPGGGEPRAAFLIEPHGVTFSPRATLVIPRQDGLGAGPFDAWEVSTTTGQWLPLAQGISPVNTDTFAVDVTRGTMICVTPRALAPRVTLTGRIVAGTNPAANFRASCWNRVSEPTTADGTFVIKDVPLSYGTFLVRVHPSRPGVDFAPSVATLVGATTVLGDVVVNPTAPDGIRPTVRTTSPADAAVNVDLGAQVLVTFSEPIDRGLPAPFRVAGRLGTVAGRISYDSAFAVRLVPTKPLEPDDRYTIVIDPAVTDLAGNRIDDKVVFDFRTRAGAAAAAPTDTVAFAISPLTARRGDALTILGRNFTGGSQVKVGATTALVTLETQEEVRANVPDFQPAGDVTVSLTAGGTAISTLRPLVLDLRAQVATVYSGATKDVPLVVVDRQRPPPVIVVDGANVGAGAITIDGVGIAAIDSNVQIGGAPVATGRTITLSTPAPATLLSGPVVIRGSNGKPGATYRFLLVREP